MKWLKNFIPIVLLIVVAVWLIIKWDVIPSFKNWLAPKKVTIDNTAVIIQSIRPLVQLVTLSAYNEIVADSTAPTTVGERISAVLNPFQLGGVFTEKKLVVVGKAVTHVGVDLKSITKNDIQITADSIHIVLPHAQILDVIVNPSGTEVFMEQGIWDNRAVEQLKSKIQSMAARKITDSGLLLQAESKAKEVITNLFLTTGYKKVTVDFNTDKARPQPTKYMLLMHI